MKTLIGLMIAGSVWAGDTPKGFMSDEARTGQYQKLLFAQKRAQKDMQDFLTAEQKKCAEEGNKNLSLTNEGILTCQTPPPAPEVKTPSKEEKK